MTEFILRLPRVAEITGLSRSTIIAMVRNEEESFPQPVRLGKRAIGWKQTDIEAWLAGRPTRNEEHWL